VVGVMSAYAEGRNAFTEHQQRVLQMFAPYLTQILSSAIDSEARALKSGRRTTVRGADRGDLRMVFNRDRRGGHGILNPDDETSADGQ
jgi:hypothetical protein